MTNRFLKITLFLAIIAGGVGIYFVTQFMATNYLANKPTGNCQSTGIVHESKIKNSSILPNKITAKLCDKLKITNLSDRTRQIAFGEHQHHQSYGANTPKFLKPHQSLTVVLIKPGRYSFHDHLQDEISASFTVLE